MQRFVRYLTILATVGVGLLLAVPARCDEIVISDYGVSSNAMVYAVAMEKGFFKAAGADVTGIVNSTGGGTTIRNLLAGRLAFGDAALQAVIQAVQSGADIRIVSAHNFSAADMTWVVQTDSPVKTLQDVRGKRIGYTNPGSGSQSLSLMLLGTLGLGPNDVEMVKAGGLGEIITAMDSGAIDIAPVYEPLLSAGRAKFRTLVHASDRLPPLTSNVGFTSAAAAASRGDFIRRVIAGRRLAVKFIATNTSEAAEAVAKVYHVSPDVAKQALEDLLTSEKGSGVPYFSEGKIRLDALDNAVGAMKIVGTLTVEPDWAKIVDETFLPDDLKGAFKGAAK